MISMDDLENRIAKALHGRADETSPNPAAWSVHRQRMSARGSRRTPQPLRRVVPLVAAAVAVAVIAVTATVANRSPSQPPTATIGETVPLPACPIAPAPAGTASPAPPQPASGASSVQTTGSAAAAPAATAPPTNRPPYSLAVDPPASGSKQPGATTADGVTPNWYSAEKGQQLAAVFRSALPPGTSIHNNTPTVPGQGLQFKGGLQGTPSSTLVVKTAQADAELTSAHGQSSLQISLMRSPTAVRDCFDTGDGRSGLRTTQADGTIIDRGQGLFNSSGNIVPSTVASQAGLAAFTVLVYRPDGSRVQVDQLQNTGEPSLTLDQLAVVASAPGFDISTPA